ncbi:hypothetical protein NC651_040384 [Populus alba x Populus x berolinensis]|nr:hypothetical protein NC651_040384 [Populus alba x Populus x berolinensis]
MVGTDHRFHTGLGSDRILNPIR